MEGTMRGKALGKDHYRRYGGVGEGRDHDL